MKTQNVGPRLAQYVKDGKLDGREQSDLLSTAKALKAEGRTAEAKLIDAVVVDAPRGLDRAMTALFHETVTADAHQALVSAAREGLGWATHESTGDVAAVLKRWSDHPPAIAEALFDVAPLAGADRTKALTVLAQHVEPRDLDVMLQTLTGHFNLDDLDWQKTNALPLPERIEAPLMALVQNPKLPLADTLGPALTLARDSKTKLHLMDYALTRLDSADVRKAVMRNAGAVGAESTQVVLRAVDAGGGDLREMIEAHGVPKAERMNTWEPELAGKIGTRISLARDPGEADALARAATRMPGTTADRLALLEKLARVPASAMALAQAGFDASWTEWMQNIEVPERSGHAAERFAFFEKTVLPLATPDERKQIAAQMWKAFSWDEVGPELLRLVARERGLPREELQRSLSAHNSRGEHNELQRELDALWPA